MYQQYGRAWMAEILRVYKYNATESDKYTHYTLQVDQ